MSHIQAFEMKIEAETTHPPVEDLSEDEKKHLGISDR